MELIEQTLDEHKDFCASEVRTYGATLRSRVLAGTTKEERETWPTKGRIASNIVKGNAHPAEIQTVQAEADARDLGETAEELAGAQFSKSIYLMTIDNTITGLTSKALNAVYAATSMAELEQTFAAIQTQRITAEAALLGG